MIEPYLLSFGCLGGDLPPQGTPVQVKVLGDWMPGIWLGLTELGYTTHVGIGQVGSDAWDGIYLDFTQAAVRDWAARRAMNVLGKPTPDGRRPWLWSPTAPAWYYEGYHQWILGSLSWRVRVEVPDIHPSTEELPDGSSVFAARSLRFVTEHLRSLVAERAA